MAKLLQGTAFITGAASGIGKSTAYALAHHGIRNLALCDIQSDKLHDTTNHLKTQHPGVDILPLEIDTFQEDSVHAAINSTTQHFSRIDIAINNAGIGSNPLPTDQLTLDDWRRVINVNLTGVWLCQRAQIRQMLRQEPLGAPPRSNRGVIVNVASMLGLVGASAGTPACPYTASKHGVVGMTRTDGIAYAARGVRINAVCPGYVATPMMERAKAMGVMDGEIAKVPQQRLSEMEEIADSIVYLASPMSSFMTGATLAVDGGYTAG